MQYAVQVNKLVKDYKDLHAVQGVSFGVECAETFSLLGPNGAGKSTTISMLSCLLAPTGGDALIMGHSITHEPQAVKAQIGVVPQEIAIYPDLSARDNLLFWGSMYRLKGAELQRRVAEVLELIGLTDRQREPSGSFSGGMKRRLNIGIALIHNPPLVIMDEPTVGIDPQSRRAILDGVKALNARGVTVLYTTHYMEEAAELSSHIAIMDKGQIIACGTHDELVHIVGELDRLEITVKGDTQTALQAWQGVPGVKKITIPDGQLVLLVEESHTVLPRLFTTAATQGITVTSVNIQEPNLEAVFLHLTGRDLRN